MKDNLLFSGLPETPSPDGHEDAQQTEIIISDFIKNKLQINENIPLQVAHRLKRRRDGRPRSIVAKFVRKERPRACIMPGLHLQRNRRKSAIQKIYDGRGNFNDGCVASRARHLRRLRCSTLTTGPSLNFHDRR